MHHKAAKIFLTAVFLSMTHATMAVPPATVAELIMQINTANTNNLDDIIDLNGGDFVLCAIDNTTDKPNGLPQILSDNNHSLKIINGTIRRDPMCFFAFRIFHVAANAQLDLDGVTIKNGLLELGVGAGIRNDGEVNITNSVIEDNFLVVNVLGVKLDAGDGVGLFNNGVASISYTTFRNNDVDVFDGDGGGIHHSSTATSLTVFSSTFVGSTVSRGGGIAAYGPAVSIINSTFSQNDVDQAGGGLYNDSNGAVILNNTFSENDANGGAGGGIYNDATISNLTSNIIAGNTASENPDIQNNGTITTAAYNLIGIDVPSDPGNHTIANGANHNKVGTEGNPLEPLLDPLADNGGPTPTYALQPNSPAIDDGANPNDLDFDQRGPGFLRTKQAQTDIGSYECQCAGCAVECVNNVEVNTVDELVAAICAANLSLNETVIDLKNKVYEFTSEHTCPGIKNLPVNGALPPIVSTITLKNGTLRRLVVLNTKTPTTKATPAFRLLVVDTTGVLGLDRISVFNGEAPSASSHGGGAYVAGSLVLRSSTFSHNTAPTGVGGAVFLLNDASLDASDSTFTENEAIEGGGAIGGAFDQGFNTSFLQVERSVKGTTFNRNRARLINLNANNLISANGGAIYNVSNLEVVESSFFNNTATTAGGAIYNDPSLLNTEGSLSQPSGGLSIFGSTFSGNSANSGGAVANLGPMSSIENSTFSNNSAPNGEGGGLFNSGTIPVVTNNTFTLNRSLAGGGIFNQGMIEDFISNIVAENEATENPDIENNGSISNATHNLIGIDVPTDPGNHTIVDGVDENQVGTAAAPIPPFLGPLEDNGGPTLTHALLLSSTAVNAGANPEGLLNDQRGSGFMRVVDQVADIGAYELHPEIPPRRSGGASHIPLDTREPEVEIPAPPLLGPPVPEPTKEIIVPAKEPVSEKPVSADQAPSEPTLEEEKSGCSTTATEPFMCLMVMAALIATRKRLRA